MSDSTTFQINWTASRAMGANGRPGATVTAELASDPTISAELFVELVTADPTLVASIINASVKQYLAAPFAIQMKAKTAPVDIESLAFVDGLTGTAEDCCADCALRAAGLLPPEAEEGDDEVVVDGETV